MITDLEARFIDIYTEFYEPVYYHIYKTVKNHALAEDLAQETFIKVLGGLKDFDSSKKPGPWLYRIARNTCIDHFRCNKATSELIDNIVCCDNEENSPENIVLDREHHSAVRSILDNMGRRYRLVMLLRYIYGLSYKEVASTLKLNEATVKTLIRRGRIQFQKAYPEAY